ncbi:MAG: tetratricopeptide repeat protein [Planctomycetes bacterium]|nr:tetratricopeptide repeat protein [Planctomycetota bacterium]
MAKKISVSSALNKKKTSAKPNDVFAAAMQAQAAGRLDEAMSLLQQVRKAAPNDPNAMLGIAMTYYLKKDFPAARVWMEKARAAHIDDGSYYLNLGLINDSEGKFDAALECHRKAVALLPQQQQGHYNMGLTLAKMGRFDEAVDAYAVALKIAPQDQDILKHLAEALLGAGRANEAMPLFAKYVSACSNKCEAWSALAEIQRNRGDINAASECYEKALSANPQAHNAHYRYACMLREAKQIAAALPHFRRAYELMPDNLGYLCDLSYATALSGDQETAAELAEKAIKAAPNSHQPYMLKGFIWVHKNNALAVESFDKALELNPAAEKEIIGLKAVALHFSGMAQDAEACFKRAIELNPNDPDVYLNYGNTLVAQARIPKCLENLAQSIRLRPTFHYAFSNVLLYSHYTPQANREYFWKMSSDYDKRFARPLMPADNVFANPKDPERKLRVGFVSSDFRTHSVSYFVEPLLRSHDREKFEFFCYANNRRNDVYTKLLQGYVENWRDILQLSDKEAAELIRQDGIDILIDLGGHTSDHRLLVFAHKPAPVQVSWLGFPDTTGLSAIDYRISDAIVDPPIFDKYSAEKVVRLPGGFHCYCPFPNAPAIVPLPQEQTGHVTFGSFNNYAKTSTEIASLWVKILNQVPGSKLMLKSLSLADEQVRSAVCTRFSRLGLDPDRIIACPRTPSIFEHLSMYNQVDIALDTWPYNGTTTTFEALWMGAPLMTLIGQTHASRVGASLLINCGLEELICQSPEEYMSKTIAFAQQPEALRQARVMMRTRLLHSPLLSEEWFTLKFEAALRGMWREYCGEKDGVNNALANLPEFVPHPVMPGAAEAAANKQGTPPASAPGATPPGQV